MTVPFRPVVAPAMLMLSAVRVAAQCSRSPRDPSGVNQARQPLPAHRNTIQFIQKP